MLRQRTTTPVKDALNARGGDENGPNSASQEGSENSEVTTSTRSPNPFEVKEEKKAEPSVSKFRAAVFPIYGAEVKKFLLMGSIKFFVIMALTLTRDTKDTLVVTQCGAEAIAFLKVRLSRAMEIGVLADGENGTMFTTTCLLHPFLALLYYHNMLDLWSVASSNRIYCALFKNVVINGKEEIILYNLHTLFCIFSLI